MLKLRFQAKKIIFLTLLLILKISNTALLNASQGVHNEVYSTSLIPPAFDKVGVAVSADMTVSCPSGQVMKSQGSGTWACGNDAGASSGAPTDAEYLVTASNGTLTNETVVGLRGVSTDIATVLLSNTGELPYFTEGGDLQSSGIASGDVARISQANVFTENQTINTTAPTYIFKDSDATAGDNNATMLVNCTDVGDGTEDCDLVLTQQINGSLTTSMTFDADGVINLDTNRTLNVGGITESSSNTLSNDISGNAGTATALASNGGNCSSGSAPLGVDASGAVESCFDVWTEAENTAAGYAPLDSPTFTTSVTLDYGTASQLLSTDGSKNLVSLSTATYPSLAELAYVKGVTSAIQTQFSGKADTTGETYTGTHDFGGGSLEIPNGTTLPATCTVGQQFMDTDATTGQRHYLCESTNTWALQGDGGSGGGAFSDASDPIVQNTTTKDVHFGDGAGTLTGKVEIGGDTDQPQLVIEGHSTQTDDVLIIQNDADSEVFSVSVTGVVTSSAGAYDGEHIQDDTIDDDSIDFVDVTLADLTFDVGSVDTTEFGYLNGVTSAIQTQLDAKADIAGAENVSGTWEIQDDVDLNFGNDADWSIQYDEGVDNQLIIETTNTSATATTDPLLEILVGTTPTADQQVFGVAKGTQASNTELFSVDEDGDVVAAASITAGGSTAGLTLGGETSDPCSTLGEGSIFYNTTSNYMCYCDGTNDLKMNDNSTACF